MKSCLVKEESIKPMPNEDFDVILGDVSDNDILMEKQRYVDQAR